MTGRHFRLAIVSNAMHPYREHLHRRIVSELPVELFSFLTHGRGDFAWSGDPTDSRIHRVSVAEHSDEKTSSARFKPLAELGKARKIAAELKKSEVDAVIVEGYADLGRLALIRSCTKAGIPTFLRADSNIRGDNPPRLLRPIKRRLLQTIIRRLTGIMPVGDLGVEYFLSYGADRDSCYIVPYEPDYDFWATPPAPSEAPDPLDSIPPDAVVFAFSGRLVTTKRVDLLIAALSAPDLRHKSWFLIVAGDGPERARLEQLVPETLRERVTFAGFCGVEQLRAIYHKADTLVVPSAAEPWGNVVTEAMSAGARIIASDVVGSAYELVDEPDVGSVFRSGDEQQLSAALARHASSPTAPDERNIVMKRLAEWRRTHDPIAGLRQALGEHMTLPRRGPGRSR